MKKEFIKDSSGAFITHILIYLKGIFLMPIIIKTVGISVYGSYALLTSMVGIAYGLSSLGVGVKSNRYLPSANSNNERAKLFYPPFYFQLMMIVLISIIIVVFQDSIISYVSDGNVIFSIYVIPLYLILYSLYAYSYNYVRNTSRIFYMNLVGLAFAYGHVLFVLFYSQYIDLIDINVLFLSQAFVSLMVSSPIIVIVYKELNIRFLFFKFNELKEQIKIGFPLVLNLIVDFILSASDRFVLAYFMGAFAVGLYVPAYTLGSIILLIPKAIGTVVPQLMAKSVDSGNFDNAKILFFNSAKVLIVIAIPFIFGIYLIGHEALILLTNEEVATKGQYIATIVAIGSLFYGLNLIMSQANMVDLKTGVIFKANVIAAVLNLVLNIVILFFIQNIYIPAVTTVISFMIASVYFYKSLDEKWMDNNIILLLLKVCIVSILMFLFVYSAMMVLPALSIFMIIIIKMLLSLISYNILVIVFKIYTINQLKNLKRVFVK